MNTARNFAQNCQLNYSATKESNYLSKFNATSWENAITKNTLIEVLESFLLQLIEANSTQVANLEILGKNFSLIRSEITLKSIPLIKTFKLLISQS